MFLTLPYFKYKMPLNLRCIQFLIVGFRKKLVYIPQI
jgi:hypothetical protein